MTLFKYIHSKNKIDIFFTGHLERLNYLLLTVYLVNICRSEVESIVYHTTTINEYGHFKILSLFFIN